MTQLNNLIKRCILFDGHCDTLIPLREGSRRFSEHGKPNPDSDLLSFNSNHLDLPRLLEAGYTAQIFACFVRETLLQNATNEGLRLVDAFYQALEQNPERFMLATRASDIEKAKEEGKIAGMLSLEGCEALEGDLAVLRTFHRLGVRHLGLTWNWRNHAADGLSEVRSGGGLTTFGEKLVRACNDLGIVVDVAHLAPAGVRDVFALSEAPVVNSHSGAQGVFDHPRHMSDDQLDGIARVGGLVGVTYVPHFLARNRHEATLSDVLDHIDYITGRIGVDHVGLGSDFDGFEGVLTDMEDVTRIGNLIQGLLDRGYTEEDLMKIVGGNYLRLVGEVVG